MQANMNTLWLPLHVSLLSYQLCDNWVGTPVFSCVENYDIATTPNRLLQPSASDAPTEQGVVLHLHSQPNYLRGARQRRKYKCACSKGMGYGCKYHKKALLQMMHMHTPQTKPPLKKVLRVGAQHCSIVHGCANNR
jgi:hypothetical protein